MTKGLSIKLIMKCEYCVKSVPDIALKNTVSESLHMRTACTIVVQRVMVLSHSSRVPSSIGLGSSYYLQSCTCSPVSAWGSLEISSSLALLLFFFLLFGRQKWLQLEDAPIMFAPTFPALLIPRFYFSYCSVLFVIQGRIQE